MRQVQLAKRVGETINYQFDFRSSLASGETLSSQSATAAVESGVDPSPSAILSGSAANSGGLVTQKITAGLPGVLYSVTMTASTSLGQVLQDESIIAILPNPSGGTSTAGEQLFPTTITDTSAPESSCTGTVEFFSNGTHLRFDNLGGSHALPNWFLPTTVGIGAGYYCRVTTVSGPWGSTLLYTGGGLLNLGLWNVLSSNKFFTVDSTAVAGHYVGVLLIEISPSPIGPATVSAQYTIDFTVPV